MITKRYVITLYSYVITTDATTQSEGYGRHLKWISYSDCCKPTKFCGLNFCSNRIYSKIRKIYILRKFPCIRYCTWTFPIHNIHCPMFYNNHSLWQTHCIKLLHNYHWQQKVLITLKSYKSLEFCTSNTLKMACLRGINPDDGADMNHKWSDNKGCTVKVNFVKKK